MNTTPFDINKTPIPPAPNNADETEALDHSQAPAEARASSQKKTHTVKLDLTLTEDDADIDASDGERADFINAILRALHQLPRHIRDAIQYDLQAHAENDDSANDTYPLPRRTLRGA